jgi:hypothetical protein
MPAASTPCWISDPPLALMDSRRYRAGLLTLDLAVARRRRRYLVERGHNASAGNSTTEGC